jgi:hypothetical protein
MLPLTNQPVYRQLLDWCEDDYPVARWINRSGFYIGCHQDLSEIDLDYMAELFERFFRQRPVGTRVGACLVITAVDKTAVEQAIETIPLDLFDELIALNDGITPETETLLKNHAVTVVPMQGSDALQMIVTRRLEIKQDNLVLFVADGRHNPRDVGRLLLALERGNDMAVASRFIVGGERRRSDQMNRYRSIGNRVFTLLANLFFYGNLSDSLSQLRAVKRSKLIALNLNGQGLPLYYRLSIRAIKRGWRVSETPTTEFVNPKLDNYWRIFLSIFPVVAVLISEWLRPNEAAQP